MSNRGCKGSGEQVRSKGTLPLILVCIIALFTSGLSSVSAVAAGPVICLYRVGNRGQDGALLIKNYLEGKGYQVHVYQGEETIEGHVQKANLINRSGATVFLAIAIATGAEHALVVARTEAPQSSGHFLTVDEIPGRFAEESQRLADSVAGALGVKAKRMPLFPLLGITMPGIFLSIKGPETDLAVVAKNLHMGLEKYFRKG